MTIIPNSTYGLASLRSVGLPRPKRRSAVVDGLFCSVMILAEYALPMAQQNTAGVVQSVSLLSRQRQRRIYEPRPVRCSSLIVTVLFLSRDLHENTNCLA